MSVILRGGRFQAVIDPLGAELKSLYDTQQQREYMWCGDPAWWNGTAPVLFPVIGGLNGGFYTYRGRNYELPSHGFARTKEFEVVRSSGGEAVFRLTGDEATRIMYPFDFELLVSFSLDYSGISVSYRVKSTSSSQSLLFSIGSHPAFRLPFDGGILEHYYIQFEHSEHTPRHYFSGGCLTGKTGEGFSNSRQIFLTRSIFDQGPLIFRDVTSREVSICKSRGKNRISVSFDTPHIGIWSKPKGAPFLCIEPWHGYPDPADFEDSLEQKPGIITLDPGKTFTTGYQVSILGEEDGFV